MASSGNSEKMTLDIGKTISADKVHKYDPSYCWETTKSKYLGRYVRMESSGGYVVSTTKVIFEKGEAKGETQSSYGDTPAEQIRRCVCEGNTSEKRIQIEQQIAFHKKEIEKLEKELSEMSGGRRRHKKTRKMRKTRKN
jgi:hypothetical protein